MKREEIKTEESKHLKFPMSLVRGITDPMIPSNIYTFGSVRRNQCFYIFNDTNSINTIHEIPRAPGQRLVFGHGCDLFKINDKMSQNLKYNYYCLIYGGSKSQGCFHVFNLQTKKWNENIEKLNAKWYNDSNIMQNGQSIYGFGNNCSMITDLFDLSIIHIAGGSESNTKYGYFQINHYILNDNDISDIGMSVCLLYVY